MNASWAGLAWQRSMAHALHTAAVMILVDSHIAVSPAVAPVGASSHTRRCSAVVNSCPLLNCDSRIQRTDPLLQRLNISPLTQLPPAWPRRPFLREVDLPRPLAANTATCPATWIHGQTCTSTPAQTHQTHRDGDGDAKTHASTQMPKTPSVSWRLKPFWQQWCHPLHLIAILLGLA